MANTLNQSNILTATLITVRAIVRDINIASIEPQHAQLLCDIAAFATANAQEALLELEAANELVNKHEAEEMDRIISISDAMDHQVR